MIELITELVSDKAKEKKIKLQKELSSQPKIVIWPIMKPGTNHKARYRSPILIIQLKNPKVSRLIGKNKALSNGRKVRLSKPITVPAKIRVMVLATEISGTK